MSLLPCHIIQRAYLWKLQWAPGGRVRLGSPTMRICCYASHLQGDAWGPCISKLVC